MSEGLLPNRHPTADFFVCDIFDALPKGDLASMEHPLFSLSTRPDRSILRYTHGPNTLEVTPSVKGRATMHDKDILIYCVSQLMAALNAGRPVAKEVHLTAHDLMVATNRETSGDGYKRLRDAFERLAGTRITTNIATAETEVTTGFGLIESWRIERRARGGRMVSVVVVLSDWLFRAVTARSVLTLSRAYFRLRRPLERRIYELVRKHCGRQAEWKVSVETLLKKSGSTSPRRVFRAMLRDIISRGTVPDYDLELGADDILRVRPQRLIEQDMVMPRASPEALEQARALVPGADVYALEAEWQTFWVRSGRRVLRAPDKAFLGWVGKRQGG